MFFIMTLSNKRQTIRKGMHRHKMSSAFSLEKQTGLVDSASLQNIDDSSGQMFA